MVQEIINYLHKHKMAVIDLCVIIEVTPDYFNSIMNGFRAPSRIIAMRLEKATKGEIPASIWYGANDLPTAICNSCDGCGMAGARGLRICAVCHGTGTDIRRASSAIKNMLERSDANVVLEDYYS